MSIFKTKIQTYRTADKKTHSNAVRIFLDIVLSCNKIYNMKVNDKAIETFEVLKDFITHPEAHTENLNEANYNLIINRFKLSPDDIYDVLDGLFSFAASKDLKEFPSTNPIYKIIEIFLKYYLDNPYKKVSIITFCHYIADESNDFLKQYKQIKFYNLIFGDYIKGASEILKNEEFAAKLLALAIYEIPVLDTLLNYRNFIMLCKAYDFIEYLVKIGYKFKFKTIEDISENKIKTIPEIYKKLKTIEPVFTSKILNIEVSYEKFRESPELLDYYFNNLECIGKIIKLFELPKIVNVEKKFNFANYDSLKSVNFIIKNLSEFSNIIKIFQNNATEEKFINLILKINSSNRHISYEEILRNGTLLNKIMEDIIEYEINIQKLVNKLIKSTDKNSFLIFDIKYELEKMILEQKHKYERMKKCFIISLFGDNKKLKKINENKEVLKRIIVISKLKNIVDDFFYKYPIIMEFIREKKIIKSFLINILFCLNYFILKLVNLKKVKINI